MNENNSHDSKPEKKGFSGIDEVFKTAIDDASAKAREAAPKVKDAIDKALQDLVYGVAYGTSFTGTFVNEFVPDAVKESVCKGASEGRQAAAEASGRMREASEKRATTPEAPADEAMTG